MTVARRNFIPYFMILAVSVSSIATDLYLPAMPVMTSFFLSSDNTLQQSISLYQLGLVFAALVYGPLSDSLGRRKMLLIGYGIFLICSTLLVFVESVEQLLWLRLLQGCGGGVSAALSPAIIRDHFTEKEGSKVIAQMSIIILLTPAVAPIAGGYLTAYFGWKSCFVFILTSVALTFFTLQRFFPNTDQTECKGDLHLSTIAKNYRNILSNKSFVFYVLFHSLPNCSLWCYITVMPFAFIKYMNVPEQQFGYFVFFQVSMVSLTSYYIQKVVMQKKANILMNNGMKFLAAGSLSLLAGSYFIPGSPWIATACVLPYMMGSPFLHATSMSKAMSYSGNAKGAAASCIAVTRQIFAFLGSLTAAILPDNTLAPTAVFMLIIVILMTASLHMARQYDTETVTA